MNITPRLVFTPGPPIVSLQTPVGEAWSDRYVLILKEFISGEPQDWTTSNVNARFGPPACGWTEPVDPDTVFTTSILCPLLSAGFTLGFDRDRPRINPLYLGDRWAGVVMGLGGGAGPGSSPLRSATPPPHPQQCRAGEAAEVVAAHNRRSVSGTTWEKRIARHRLLRTVNSP